MDITSTLTLLIGGKYTNLIGKTRMESDFRDIERMSKEQGRASQIAAEQAARAQTSLTLAFQRQSEARVKISTGEMRAREIASDRAFYIETQKGRELTDAQKIQVERRIQLYDRQLEHQRIAIDGYVRSATRAEEQITLKTKIEEDKRVAAAKAATDAQIVQQKRLSAESRAQLKHRTNAVTGAGIVTGGGAAYLAYKGLAANIDFEKQLSHIQAFANASPRDISYYRKNILRTSPELGIDPSTMAAGLYNVSSAGIHGKAAWQLLYQSAKLGAASQTPVSDVTNIATNMYNAYGPKAVRRMGGIQAIMDAVAQATNQGKMEVGEFSKALGAPIPLAGRLGVNVQNIGSMFATMTNRGISTQQAGQDIFALMRTGLHVNMYQRNAIRASGYDPNTFFDMTGKHGVENFMRRVQTASGVDPSVIRQRLLETPGMVAQHDISDAAGNILVRKGDLSTRGLRMFQQMGTPNNRLFQLLGNSESLQAYLGFAGGGAFRNNLWGGAGQMGIANASRGGGAINRSLNIANQSDYRKIEQMQASMKVLAITIGAAVAPSFRELAKTLIPVMREFGAWTQQHPAFISGALKAALVIGGISLAVRVMTTVFGPALGLGKALFNSFRVLDGEPGMMRKLSSSIWDVSQTIGKTVLSAGKSFALWAADSARAAASIVGDIVATTAKQVWATSVTAVQAAKQGAIWLGQRAVMLASAAATGVMTAAQWALNVAMDANPIGLVIVGLVALGAGVVLLYNKWKPFHEFVNAAGARLREFGAKIIPVVTNAFHSITAVAGNTLDWLKSNWKMVLVIMTAPISLIVVAVIKFGPTILRLFQGAVNATLSWVRVNWANLQGIFQTTLTLVTTSIRNFGTQMLTDIRGGINAAIGWVKGNWKTLLFDAIGGPIALLATTVWNVLPERWKTKAINAVTGFITGAGSLTKKLGTAGQNIAKAIIDGLHGFWNAHNPVSWIGDKLSALGDLNPFKHGGSSGALILPPGGGQTGIFTRGKLPASSLQGPEAWSGEPYFEGKRAIAHDDLQYKANTPIWMPRLPKGESYHIEFAGFETEGGNTVAAQIVDSHGHVVGHFNLMHLNAIARSIRTGGNASVGQYIGVTGNTGAHTDGAHLHFAFDQGAYNALVAAGYRPPTGFADYSQHKVGGVGGSSGLSPEMARRTCAPNPNDPHYHDPNWQFINCRWVYSPGGTASQTQFQKHPDWYSPVKVGNTTLYGHSAQYYAAHPGSSGYTVSELEAKGYTPYETAMGHLGWKRPKAPNVNARLPSSIAKLWPIIQKVARQTGIAPNVIASLVYQESRGQANSRSYNSLENVWDIGLTQVGPHEATLGHGKYTYAAQGNIRAGAGYLEYLLHGPAHGNLAVALAMYNGGPGGAGLKDAQAYSQSVLARASTYSQAITNGVVMPVKGPAQQATDRLTEVLKGLEREYHNEAAQLRALGKKPWFGNEQTRTRATHLVTQEESTKAQIAMAKDMRKFLDGKESWDKMQKDLAWIRWNQEQQTHTRQYRIQHFGYNAGSLGHVMPIRVMRHDNPHSAPPRGSHPPHPGMRWGQISPGHWGWMAPAGEHWGQGQPIPGIGNINQGWQHNPRASHPGMHWGQANHHWGWQPPAGKHWGVTGHKNGKPTYGWVKNAPQHPHANLGAGDMAGIFGGTLPGVSPPTAPPMNPPHTRHGFHSANNQHVVNAVATQIGNAVRSAVSPQHTGNQSIVNRLSDIHNELKQIHDVLKNSNKKPTGTVLTTPANPRHAGLQPHGHPVQN